MRRILTISLLAAVLLLALAVPVLADPPDNANCSDPPNAWGEDTSAYAQWTQDQYGQPYGRWLVRYLAWGKWSPWYFDHKNYGDYVNDQKAGL